MSLVKAEETEMKMPSPETFKNLFKKAIADDKPVLFDYYMESIEKKVSIGVRELPNKEKEKILVRSSEEYTSCVINIFKSGGEFIVVTENSIYVVDAGIPIKRISS